MKTQKISNKKRNCKAKELAKKFNVTERTIRKFFSQDREEFLKENALRRAEMYKLKQEGWSLSQIGEKYGTTKNNISLLIKKHKERYDNQVNLF